MSYTNKIEMLKKNYSTNSIESCTRKSQLDEFLRKGFKERDYFDHEVIATQKFYPYTTYNLMLRGYNEHFINSILPIQINIYAPALASIGDDILWDGQVNWHRQQMEKPGLVAAAGLCIDHSETAMVSIIQSDINQQVYKFANYKSKYKTRLRSWFGKWNLITYNAILDFALSAGIKTVLFPTTDSVFRHVKANVLRDIYDTIYDSVANTYLCRKTTIKGHDYWKVNVAENQSKIAILEDERVKQSHSKVVCILHDTEENVDTDIDIRSCEDALESMLEIEHEANISTTYNVLGTLYNKKNQLITKNNQHAIGFHSFNHVIGEEGQIEAVREVDLQVKGYRPPQSRLTAELNNFNLQYHNFEWLCSSSSSLGISDITLEHGIVKIPVDTDDWLIQSGQMSYENWKDLLLKKIEDNAFFSFGLHDCYSKHWLQNYPELIRSIKSIGVSFQSCDQVAAHAFLLSSCEVRANIDRRRSLSKDCAISSTF